MSGRSVVLAALALLVPALLHAQAPAARGAAAPATLTRSASKYQSLEFALIQAAADGDQAQLARLLPDDFEVWSAERTGAVSRQAWLQTATRVRDTRIRDLTVREFGDIAVVSFLQTHTSGPGPTSTTFVVDVWSQSAGTLTVRYLSTPARPAPNQGRRE
jgi:hypothetical protein